MNENTKNGPTRSYLHISLKSIFILTTCVCCYIADEIRGRRYQTIQPTLAGNSIRIYRCIHENFPLPNADKAKLLTTLGRKIKTDVLPLRFDSTTTGCRISTDTKTGSLIVVADPNTHMAVHRAVEIFQEELLASSFTGK